MSDAETKPCPRCAAPSALVEVGTASGQGTFDCPKHGVWREKNPHAVALGRDGGKARQEAMRATMTEEEISREASERATKRWRDEKLSKNLKFS